MTVETINFWLALGTLAMQVVAVAFLAMFFLRKSVPDLEDIASFLGRHGLWIGLLFSLGGTVLSLYYDSLGFPACSLCWWQRVFLYSQVVLFALALWKRDSSIADYSIALSVCGGIVALYQHYLQMGGTSVVPCPADISQGMDCAQRFLFEFNYITFPLMSFTLFAFLIILMFFVRGRR